MSAIQLSYSTFGLNQLGLKQALQVIDSANYSGAELAFHRHQFNPFNFSDTDLENLKGHLDTLKLTPACIATASYFFNPYTPHEPSLIALEKAGRMRRIDLIKRGIYIARKLGVKLVTFGSGFLRAEHLEHLQQNVQDLLAQSIQTCLKAIGENEDITLLIEPEPGMYIETLEQGVRLVKRINSEKFKLHIDLCHVYCSQHEPLHALAKAARYARYLHISDAPAGYNLKVVQDHAAFKANLEKTQYLVHFPDTVDYLLIDRTEPTYFHQVDPSRMRILRIERLLADAGVTAELRFKDYNSLYAGQSFLDDEIFTWLISIPGLSFDVLERARPIVAYLRGVKGPIHIDKRVAHTQTGIAHFHEIPGAGLIDFGACFNALTQADFHGFAALELYHHIEDWQEALSQNYDYLMPLLNPATRPKPHD